MQHCAEPVISQDKSRMGDWCGVFVPLGCASGEARLPSGFAKAMADRGWVRCNRSDGFIRGWKREEEGRNADPQYPWRKPCYMGGNVDPHPRREGEKVGCNPDPHPLQRTSPHLSKGILLRGNPCDYKGAAFRLTRSSRLRRSIATPNGRTPVPSLGRNLRTHKAFSFSRRILVRDAG
ncbi:hypothetical protein APED_22105 [Acanthopleuribacter pedis]